ncbi:hypothetical protein HGRIS_010130 [Hohenbuehelia grisea]|uniref:NAD-dependent epimerase/dehydratase domain-containing protein n=1 Tax=Hohenbuehelia grisea TaxID=104357 RepID=A0ABR3J3B3_9AGAR
MKVLVLGATGFIGFPVAQALVRAGHIVYGVTRSESKTKQLAAEEIIPIVASPTSDAWHSYIASLDVVIEAVGGAEQLAADSAAILQAVTRAAQTLRPEHAPKLTFIYTSGTWVHGDSATDIVSDTTPLTRPIQLTSWRPAHEQAVIKSDVLNGIVIRPSLLYGRSGSILSWLFGKAAQSASAGGPVQWVGKPGGRYSTVHADDLADLYLRAAEKAQLVGGQIFDGSNNSSESVDDLLQRLIVVSNAKGAYEYVQPSNPFESAITTTAIIRPYLARALLGWIPRKPSLVDGLDVYYAAFLASQ